MEAPLRAGLLAPLRAARGPRATASPALTIDNGRNA